MPATWSDDELRSELEVVVTAGAKLSENPSLQHQIRGLLTLVELKWPEATYSEKARRISKLLEEAIALAAGSTLSDDQEEGYRILFGIQPASRGKTAAVRRDDAATYLAPPRAPRRTRTGERQSEISGASMWARRRNEVLQPIVEAIGEWRSEHDHSSDGAEAIPRSCELLQEVLVSFSYELGIFLKVRDQFDARREQGSRLTQDMTLDQWNVVYGGPNPHTRRGLSTDNLLYKFSLVQRVLRDFVTREELDDVTATAAHQVLSNPILGSLGNEDIADILAGCHPRSRVSLLEALKGSERGRDLLRIWSHAVKDECFEECWKLNFQISLLAGLLGSQRPADQRVVTYCAEQASRLDSHEGGLLLHDLLEQDRASGWGFSGFPDVWDDRAIDELDRKIEKMMDAPPSD